MKKLILSAFSVLAIGSIVFISCKSKNDSDAITPTYAAEDGGGGNPNITNVTTTGTVATTSTMQSSSIYSVGIGAAWQSSGCTLGQTCLSNNNTSTGTTISICFSSPPVAGVYSLVNSSSALGPNKAFMTVTNPPSQDANTVWYSSAGNITVTVGVGGNPIKAFFSNIACYKTVGSFYSVTVSGEVGCL